MVLAVSPFWLRLSLFLFWLWWRLCSFGHDVFQSKNPSEWLRVIIVLGVAVDARRDNGYDAFLANGNNLVLTLTGATFSVYGALVCSARSEHPRLCAISTPELCFTTPCAMSSPRLVNAESGVRCPAGFAGRK